MRKDLFVTFMLEAGSLSLSFSTNSVGKTHFINSLQVFISKIRNCKNKEEEKTTVDKEMGKIRKKFTSNNTVTGLQTPAKSNVVSSRCSYIGLHVDSVSADYDRKKYVWKLLYIYMLGYDVEFGHKQAADLIPTNK